MPEHRAFLLRGRHGSTDRTFELLKVENDHLRSEADRLLPYDTRKRSTPPKAQPGS